MTSSRDVTVVIPTCGRASLLRGTLDALLMQQYDPRQMEVIVVSDGPDSETAALVAELASRAPFPVKFIDKPRQGAGIARNRGIREATGRVVLMLDDDITAAPRLVSSHIAHHRSNDDVVVIGALQIEPRPDEPVHRRIVREWWDGEFRDMALGSHRFTFRDFVTGNVSVTRQRLIDVGLFDEAFTGYGREDYELGLRLQQAGARFVHEPAAAGIHHYEKPVVEWLRMFRAMGRADATFARRHPDRIDEVMALTPFPRWPGVGRVIPLLERFVLSSSDRERRAWLIAAALTQSAHYWAGLEAEVQDGAELKRLVEGRRRIRESLAALERAHRGSRWQRLWRRLNGRRPRDLARMVSRALGRTPLV